MFGSPLIFGSHFPFRVAQLRDARVRGRKLSPRDTVQWLHRFHQGPEEGRTNGPENISLDRCRTLYEPVDKHPHARREVLTETSLRPCETLGPASRRVSFLGPTSWLPPATVHDRERLSAPRRIVRRVVNLSVYAA
jgi:hypothetical protein